MSNSSFSPDLIVEATAVCDRACVGCYAPNVVSKQNLAEAFQKNPEFYLDPRKLEATLRSIAAVDTIESIAFRGGEPSLHPSISHLLQIAAKNSKDVFLETHGRWIQQDSPHSLELLETCKKFEIKVKVSFDKMHGLKPADLKKMWDKLNSLSIKTFVAITEDSKANFEDTRQLCEWIPESQIIAQAKATTLENLVRPRIGVIDRTSNLNRHLTTRFFPKSESEVVA